MSTPYSKVFDSFLSKIEDTRYLEMTNEEVVNDLLKLLNSAIVRFEYPKVDILDKDDTSETFNLEISHIEVEIIANLMTLEWIKRQTKSISLIKQAMTDRDFKLTSQANHLKVLMELKLDIEKDVNELKNKYSYQNNHKANFDGLAGD